jgi:ketosteroid isomerase-like protein
MAHPNEELVRKGYEAFNTGDMDTIRETFDPNIVWHIGGRSDLAGDYKGVDEVLGFFGKIIGMFDAPPQLELHDVLANDEHAVALIKSTSKKGGKSRTSEAVHLFHVKDGKATEFWDHPLDMYGDDEFLAS